MVGEAQRASGRACGGRTDDERRDKERATTGEGRGRNGSETKQERRHPGPAAQRAEYSLTIGVEMARQRRHAKAIGVDAKRDGSLRIAIVVVEALEHLGDALTFVLELVLFWIEPRSQIEE